MNYNYYRNQPDKCSGPCIIREQTRNLKNKSGELAYPVRVKLRKK